MEDFSFFWVVQRWAGRSCPCEKTEAEPNLDLVLANLLSNNLYYNIDQTIGFLIVSWLFLNIANSFSLWSNANLLPPGACKQNCCGLFVCFFCCCLQFCLLVHHQLLAGFQAYGLYENKGPFSRYKYQFVGPWWQEKKKKRKKRRKCIGATLLAAGWFRVRMRGHRAAVWGAVMSAWLNSNGLRTDGRLVKVCLWQAPQLEAETAAAHCGGEAFDVCGSRHGVSRGGGDKAAAVC